MDHWARYSIRNNRDNTPLELPVLAPTELFDICDTLFEMAKPDSRLNY
jgi:hypothetical protein